MKFWVKRGFDQIPRTPLNPPLGWWSSLLNIFYCIKASNKIHFLADIKKTTTKNNNKKKKKKKKKTYIGGCRHASNEYPQHLCHNVRKHTFGHFPSEESNPSVRSRSLIRIYTECILDSHGCKLSSCIQRRLWSDYVAVQADLSLRWAHISEGTFSQVTVHLFSWKNKKKICIIWVSLLSETMSIQEFCTWAQRPA